MNCYDVIADQNVSKAVRDLVLKLDESLECILSSEAVIGYGDSLEAVQLIDTLRYFVELNLGRFSNNALANIFLSHLNSTEIKSAGSGIIFCTAFIENIKKALQYQRLGQNYDIETHSFSGQRCDIKKLQEILTGFSDSGNATLVRKAAHSVGAEGALTVSTHTTSARTHINVDDLYRFEAKISDVFRQQTGRVSFEIIKPKIVTIDGFIESTSEIDRLMRESFETNHPLVVFARGYHGDVSNTLAQNYIKGKLRVLPVEVRYDEVGANALIDISKVSGSKFINSLTGDLISTTTFEESGIVDRLTLSGDTVGLELNLDPEDLRQKIIHRQRLKLIKQRDLLSEPAQKIIDKRISSLTPSHCEISVRCQKGQQGIQKDRTSLLIRMMKEIASEGFVDLTSLDLRNSYLLEKVKDRLVKAGLTQVSTRSINSGLLSAAICTKTFTNLGACLIIDEC